MHRFFHGEKFMKHTKIILKSYQINKKYQNELKKEYELFKAESKEKAKLKQELSLVDKEIENVIGSIMALNQPSKSILLLRYVKQYSYEVIAFKLNYSTQRIYQLLNVALKEFKTEYESRLTSNNVAI